MFSARGETGGKKPENSEKKPRGDIPRGLMYFFLRRFLEDNKLEVD